MKNSMIMRFKRVMAILMAILLTINIMPLGSIRLNSVSADAESFKTLTEKLNDIEGVEVIGNENDITVAVSDEYRQKVSCVNDMLKAIFSDGNREALTEIMDGSASLKINNKALKFGKLNKEKDAYNILVDTIKSAVSGEESIESIINGVINSSKTNTGIVVTLNDNIDVLDSFMSISTQTEEGVSKAQKTVRKTWEDALENGYDKNEGEDWVNVHKRRRNASKTLLEAICEAGILNDNIKVEYEKDDKKVNVTLVPKYKVTLELHNASADVYKEVAKGTTLDKAVEGVVPTREGYSFAGWKVGETTFDNETISSFEINEAETVEATWNPRNDTNYTVKYFFMDTAGNYPDDESDEIETVIKQGTTETDITADMAKKEVDIEGFAYEKIEGDTKIKADGKSSVNCYYSRNKWLAHLVDENKEYLYGQTVEEPTYPDYQFKGWATAAEEGSLCAEDNVMPNSDIYATWVESTGVYTLEPSGEPGAVIVDGVLATNDKFVLIKKDNDVKSYILNGTEKEFPAEGNVVFSEKGKYEITLVFKSGVKNKEKINFVIDKSSPTCSASSGITEWKEKAPDVTFNNIVDSTEGKDSTGLKYIEFNYVVGTMKKPISSAEGTDIKESNTIEWNAIPEGEYDIVATIYDNVGNKAESTVHIMKDTQEPTYNKSEDISWTDKNKNVVFSEITDPTKDTSVSSDVSGLKSIEINYIEGTSKTNKLFETEVNQSYEITWEELPEGEYDVEAIVYDKAGNLTKEVVHVQKDTQELTYNKSEDISWTDKNKNILFSEITDPTKDTSVSNVVSGLKKIEINYVENDNRTEIISDENVKASYEIKWADLKEGEYDVEAIVYDKADNSTIKTVHVQKDTQEPTYNKSEDISWTDKNKNILFSEITDPTKDTSVSSDVSGLKEIVINYVEGEKKTELLSDDTVDSQYEFSWSELPEGEYDIEAVVYDNAGNSKTEVVHVQKDTQAPTFNASANIKAGNEEGSVEWANDDNKANVVFSNITDPTKDTNISTDVSGIIEISVKYKNDSNGREGADVDKKLVEVSEDGKTYCIPWENLLDGSYVIVATVTDRAGNSTSKEVRVQKDTKAPDFKTSNAIKTVEITEGETTVAWANQEWADDNKDSETESGASSVFIGDIDLTDNEGNKEAGIKSFVITIVSGDYSQTLFNYPSNNNPELVDYKRSFDSLPEGDYYFSASLTDDAGNNRERKIHVMKDTQEPTYKKSEDISWTDKNKNVVFSEITDPTKDTSVSSDVSGLKSIEINYIEGTSKTNKLFETEVNQSYEITWEELPEGEYDVEAIVYDNADNSRTEVIHVQKDTQEPTYKKSEDISWTDKNKNVVFSEITDPTKDTSVSTDVSGVKKIEINYVENGKKTAIISDEAVKTTYELEWSSLKEGEYDVEAIVYDNADNSRTEVIHVQKDTQEPTYKSSEDITWKDKEKNVIFSKITDPTKDTSVSTDVSGLKSIEINYIEDGKKTLILLDTNVKDTYEFEWKSLHEGEYDIEAVVYDNAENSKKIIVHVKKDTNKPFFNNTSDIKPDGTWANNSNKADVVVSDISDPTKDITVSSDVSGLDLLTIDFEYKNVKQNILKEKGSSIQNGYTINWNDLPQGNYYIKITLTDKADNTSTSSVHVMKDIDKPLISIEAKGTSEKAWDTTWNKLQNSISFIEFSQKDVGVTISYNDPVPADDTEIKGQYKNEKDRSSVRNDVAGISNVKYFVSEKVYTSVDELKMLNDSIWDRSFNIPDNEALKVGTKTLKIDTENNRKAVVYVRVEDNAGNVSYCSSNGIIVDKKQPKPEIDIKISEAANGLFNSSVPVVYSVTEPENAGAYSGLKSVTYEIINGDNPKNNVTKVITYDKEKNIKTTDNKAVTIDGSKFNSNNVKFKVSAVDWANNSSSKEIKLKIDTTSPSIDVSYENALHEDKYYRENRVATITITERNFDPKLVDITITKDGTRSGMASNIEWRKVDGNGNGDNTKHIGKITYSDDADYTFDIKCKDKATNKNSKVNYTGGNEKEFTVDKTNPIVTVTFDSVPYNTKYFNADVTLKVVVKEHNFDSNKVDFKVSNASNIGSFSNTGTDEYTAYVYFTHEADCEFDVEYIDKAGNKAKYNDQSGSGRDDYGKDEFVVDKTAPKNIVFKTKANSANKGNAEATFDFDENNFYDGMYHLENRKEAIDIKINGYKNGDVTRDFPFRLLNRNGKIEVEFGDFPNQIQWDDVYTITTTVSDLAGNKSQGKIVFSVNRFGSNYVLGKSTEELVDKYYSNKSQDVEVYEISASTDYVSDYSVSTVINGERKELSEDSDNTTKDFAVDHNWIVEYPKDYDVNGENNVITVSADMLKEVGSTDSTGWKINHYKVRASNFDAEGEYTVVITSVDTAGNSMSSNTSKYESEKDIVFMHDKSTPNWRIKNRNEKDMYNGVEYDFEIAVSDDISSVDTVELSCGDRHETFDSDDVVSGTVNFKVKEKLGSQKLALKITDKAGNVLDEDYEFVLTSSALFSFFYLYGIYLGIGSAVLVGGGVGVFAYRRKRL